MWKKMRKTGLAIGMIGATVVWSLGCTKSLTSPSEKTKARQLAALNEIAVPMMDGVRVKVHSDAWPGDAAVIKGISPVLLAIENASDTPILIRYQDFSLVTLEGKRFAAIPPFELSLGEPFALVRPYPSLENSTIIAENFRIAPSYATLYPELRVYHGDFPIDPKFHRNHFTYWSEALNAIRQPDGLVEGAPGRQDLDEKSEVRLPSERMLQEVIPEGVLREGGLLVGFFYFEKVPQEVGVARLRVELVDARTARTFGEINLPIAKAPKEFAERS